MQTQSLLSSTLYVARHELTGQLSSLSELLGEEPTFGAACDFLDRATLPWLNAHICVRLALGLSRLGRAVMFVLAACGLGNEELLHCHHLLFVDGLAFICQAVCAVL